MNSHSLTVPFMSMQFYPEIVLQSWKSPYTLVLLRNYIGKTSHHYFRFIRPLCYQGTASLRCYHARDRRRLGQGRPGERRRIRELKLINGFSLSTLCKASPMASQYHCKPGLRDRFIACRALKGFHPVREGSSGGQ